MTMFTLAQHESWCLKPAGDGPALIHHGGYCLGVIRRSWGLNSLGATALDFARSIPLAERHWSDPLDVPQGAICFGLNGLHGEALSPDGHVWVASTRLLAWSTDYSGTGTFALAPMALPRWTHVAGVQWTSWTPFGRLPVGRTQRQRNAPSPVPAVHLANLRYGVHHADVKVLQGVLNHHLGTRIAIDGIYGSNTDAAVRRCQSLHVPPADPAGHSYVGPTQAHHLGLHLA